ncbi:ABC transporter substrate-binding protein [Vibrio sonorensis]|uniref:ABC transporter substrate-binding protein n=1 Tax=Vibrio sonorensis TaxID=1004316 RepID=UPI000A3E1B4B|nr:extracellular solute-binding protein [Vibrio sonorensis]
MRALIMVFMLLFCVSAKSNSLLSVPTPILLPEIENKTPITLVAEKGFWTDYLNENIIAEFTKATGVEVVVHSASLGDMYQLQTNSMQNGNGKFDVVTIEAGWAKEWAANGYTVPVVELIREFDPQAASDIGTFSSNYYPALLSLLSYEGELHSLPYNSYVMGNHYRKDLFEHEGEREKFFEQYGYPLQAPVTFEQLMDVAKFFTRKQGESLAGRTLQENFYGVSLMSGNRPHINDELSSILWGMGGKWFLPEFSAPKLSGFTYVQIPILP